MADPLIVANEKVRKGIRASPAGIEMRCRTTGKKREKKMPPAEKRRMNRSAASTLLSDMKKYLPYRMINGRPNTSDT